MGRDVSLQRTAAKGGALEDPSGRAVAAVDPAVGVVVDPFGVSGWKIRFAGATASVVTTFVALLRGINVTGKNKVPMAELRSLAEGQGLQAVRTYIQSGNLVFEASGAAARLEALLESAISKRFKLSIPVVVRSAAKWRGYVASNPFREACETRPNLVHLALSKQRPAKHAVEELEQRAQNRERVVATGEALWIDYPEGSGTSKLTPALFDRLVGSPVTARNWRTVLKLESMLR